MTNPVDLSAAAKRHLRCAEALAEQQNPEHAEAGYLYGLAAECAVKSIAESIPRLRRDDVLYAHFPDLRRLLLDHAQGRSTDRLARLLADQNYMSGWRIRMRYEGNQSVPSDQLHKWTNNARAAVQLMEAA